MRIKNYLIQSINKTIRFFINLSLYRSSSDDKLNILKNAYGTLKTSPEKIMALNSKEIISQYDDLEKIELLALTFFHESRSKKEPAEKRKLQQVSRELLEYVDQRSRYFSLERKEILEKMKKAKSK